MEKIPTPAQKQEPIQPTKPKGVVAPVTPATAFRATATKGAQLTRSTPVLFEEGLSPGVIDEIRSQKASGNFRKIAGRPWWATVYSGEELEKAGLT